MNRYSEFLRSELEALRVDRRSFMRIMTAALAAGLLAACESDKSPQPVSEFTPNAPVATPVDEGTVFQVTEANQDYYVDSSRGNDNGAGTIDSPWKTIAKASRSAQAGDTVYIRAGDYRSEGAIEITRSGRSGAPIRFTAYEQEAVILERLMVQDSQWITINGLRIVGPKALPAHWREMPEIVVDDPTVGVIDTSQAWKLGREAKVGRKYATFITLETQWIKDWSAGITVHHSDYILLQHNDITQHTVGINVVNESSHVFIVDNRLHHMLLGSYSDHNQDYAYSMHESLIARNYVFQNLSAGIRVLNNAHHNHVEANQVEFNGLGHIDIRSGSSYNIVRGNRVSQGGFYAETMQHPGTSGIGVHSSGPGNRVESNFIAYQYDITGRDGNGMTVDYNPVGALVANNIIYRNMGSGIASVHSGNSYFLHNTVVENGYGATVPSWNGSGIRVTTEEDVNNVIANNILSYNSRGGLVFGGQLSRQAFVDYNLIDSDAETPLATDK